MSAGKVKLYSIGLSNKTTYITKRGYVILKNEYPDDVIKEVKSDLVVSPIVNPDYSGPAVSFKIYMENRSKMYIPKFYGIQKFGQPKENKIPEPIKINLTFNGSLRDTQKIPVEKATEAFDKYGGGILSLPCGGGKTVIACYLIAQLKVKTFVLVHKEFLMEQWIERILEGDPKKGTPAFLPGAKIGRIQGSIVDVEDKDIVIGMIQSISMKDYPIDLFDNFGLVIIDEAHRTPSKEFSKALHKINSKYMLALSATPDRKDGLTKVLKWHVGDMFYRVEEKKEEECLLKIERYVYNSTNDVYASEEINFRGKLNPSCMINNICRFMPRTRFICKKLIENYNEGRTIILLSNRREHLSDIEKILREDYDIDSIGYYIGGMKKEKLKNSETKRFILATFSMAAEGLDIATIDTIFFCSPKTDVEQAAGRIRPRPGCPINIQPKIVDIIDDFSMFSSQAESRYRFYKEQRKYEIHTYHVNEDGSSEEMIKIWHPKNNPVKPKRQMKNKTFYNKLMEQIPSGNIWQDFAKGSYSPADFAKSNEELRAKDL